MRPRLDLACRLALAGALLLATLPARAGLRLTGDEALALAFPGCEIARKTVFLTDAQRTAAEALAAGKIESALVHPYVATCEGKPGGTGYFEVHRVRTLPERLLVAVGPEGKVLRIEVLSFDEPIDYLPRAGWYGQFVGKGLEDDLRLEGDIHPIAGATLTARATTRAVRRVLALHRVLNPREGKAP